MECSLCWLHVDSSEPITINILPVLQEKFEINDTSRISGIILLLLSLLLLNNTS